jgi:hypothetical protein
MTPSLPEGKALRCKLVHDFAGSDVEPDLPVVIAILITQRSVNDRLCSLAGAVLRGRPQVGIGVERRGGLRVAERALTVTTSQPAAMRPDAKSGVGREA